MKIQQFETLYQPYQTYVADTICAVFGKHVDNSLFVAELAVRVKDQIKPLCKVEDSESFDLLTKEIFDFCLFNAVHITKIEDADFALESLIDCVDNATKSIIFALEEKLKELGLHQFQTA
jgi:hypothetical protein